MEPVRRRGRRLSVTKAVIASEAMTMCTAIFSAWMTALANDAAQLKGQLFDRPAVLANEARAGLA